LKITKDAQIIGLLFSTLLAMNLDKKWVGLGRFWAMLSQTHLVTLVVFELY
jgi:hypothetical protein